MTAAGSKLGIDPKTLRGWVRRAQVDGGISPGLTNDERQRLKELGCEVRDVCRANDILTDSPISSRPSSTAQPGSSALHRFAKGSLGSRADLQGPAVRSRHVLQSEFPVGPSTTGAR